MIGVMKTFSQTVPARPPQRKMSFGAETQQPQPAAATVPAKAAEPTAHIANGVSITPVVPPQPVAPPGAVKPVEAAQAQMPKVQTPKATTAPVEKPAKKVKAKRIRKQAIGKQIYKAFLKELAANTLSWRVDGYDIHEGKRTPSAFVTQMLLDPETIRHFDKLKLAPELFKKGTGADSVLKPVEVRLWKSHQDDLLWEVAHVNIHSGKRQNGALLLWPVNTLLNAITGRPLGHFLTPIPGVINEYRSNHIFNALTRLDSQKTLGRTPKAEVQVAEQQENMTRKALWASVLKAAQQNPKPVEITQDVLYGQARKLFHLAPVQVKPQEAEALGFAGETTLKVTLVSAREWEFYLNDRRQFPQLLAPPSPLMRALGLGRWLPHHREFYYLQQKVLAALSEKPAPKKTEKKTKTEPQKESNDKNQPVPAVTAPIPAVAKAEAKVDNPTAQQKLGEPAPQK